MSIIAVRERARNKEYTQATLRTVARSFAHMLEFTYLLRLSDCCKARRQIVSRWRQLQCLRLA